MPGSAASVSLRFKWRTFLSSRGTCDCIFIQSCSQIRAGECIYWNLSNVCWDWNTSSYLAINKWWCCEMFPDHSGGRGLKGRTAAVGEWIEPRDSPSGLGAQPPVTPLQPQQEIIQFHPRAIGRSPVWWAILWASRENRSYLELRLPGPLFLSITPRSPDTPRHLAETLAITRLCSIRSGGTSKSMSNAASCDIMLTQDTCGALAFMKPFIQRSCLEEKLIFRSAAIPKL